MTEQKTPVTDTRTTPAERIQIYLDLGLEDPFRFALAAVRRNLATLESGLFPFTRASVEDVILSGSGKTVSDLVEGLRIVEAQGAISWCLVAADRSTRQYAASVAAGFARRRGLDVQIRVYGADAWPQANPDNVVTLL